MADRGRRLRRLVLAGLVVAVALAVAGCTGGTDTPEPAQPGANGGAAGGPLGAGREHSCVVRDGTVACWGANRVVGQLGAGTDTDRGTPVTVEGLRDAVVVAAGGWHTCALRSNATVACWGSNLFGEVGDGTSVLDDVDNAARLAPVAVKGVDDVVGVTAGWRHTCALRQGGGIWCWGHNGAGQLGRHTRGDWGHTPGVVWAPGWGGLLGHRPLADAVALAAGGEHTCAVRASGTVACWGEDDADRPLGIPVAIEGVADAVGIAAGAVHTCALRADGSVACWGVNDWGQLGDGTHRCVLRADDSVDCRDDGVIDYWSQRGDGTDRARPAAVAVEGLGDAVAVAAGNAHTCALRAGGEVACWGFNKHGQLGDATTINRSTPVSVEGLDDAVAIAAGWSHTCALREDGDVACWGHNEDGQLGDATTTERHTPTPVTFP